MQALALAYPSHSAGRAGVQASRACVAIRAGRPRALADANEPERSISDSVGCHTDTYGLRLCERIRSRCALVLKLYYDRTVFERARPRIPRPRPARPRSGLPHPRSGRVVLAIVVLRVPSGSAVLGVQLSTTEYEYPITTTTECLSTKVLNVPPD